MHAAWFSRFGPAAEVLELGEQPTPSPGAGEVLVRLQASGVNPSDVRKRAGAAASLLDEGPVIPHSDGAGVIEAVGAGVPASRIGERVWTYQAQHGRRFGTAAQYVALESRRAPRLPNGADFATGACLGIPAMTAHRCVFVDGPPRGERVLVTGGAGRVGAYALQWAAAAGADVIATASNAADRESCFALGARAVVNHREPGWAAQVLAATGGAKIDRVVDVEFGANLPEVLDCIRTGGSIATYASVQVPEPCLPFRRMMFMDLTIRMVIVYDMPEAAKDAAIHDINRSIAAGNLQHRIGAQLPLESIAEGHRLVESPGVRGCVILDIA